MLRRARPSATLCVATIPALPSPPSPLPFHLYVCLSVCPSCLACGHRLEEGNEGRREEVAALNVTLERETASWEESCRVFEEELTGLAAKLRSARTHFVGGLFL